MDFDKTKQAELIAEELCDKFGTRKWHAFYCKVGYNLSEAKIWANYEKATTSLKARDPGRLFFWLCEKDMSRG
jgi:hypothetical protein